MPASRRAGLRLFTMVKASASDGITHEAQNGILSAVADPISAAADTFVNDCYRGKLTLSKSIEGSDVFSERKGGLAGGEKTPPSLYGN